MPFQSGDIIIFGSFERGCFEDDFLAVVGACEVVSTGYETLSRESISVPAMHKLNLWLPLRPQLRMSSRVKIEVTKWLVTEGSGPPQYLHVGSTLRAACMT